MKLDGSDHVLWVRRNTTSTKLEVYLDDEQPDETTAGEPWEPCIGIEHFPTKWTALHVLDTKFEPELQKDDNEAPQPPRRAPGIHADDLLDIFTYHRPDSDQAHAMANIREGALNFALVITRFVPNCPDRTAAIRKLRETVMTANAAIVLGGKY